MKRLLFVSLLLLTGMAWANNPGQPNLHVGCVPNTKPCVDLTWSDSNPSGSIAGYNVYRSTTSGGACPTGVSVTPINGTLITPKSYTDNNRTAGTTAYYAVSAVGTNGGESTCSNEVLVTFPSEPPLPVSPGTPVPVVH